MPLIAVRTNPEQAAEKVEEADLPRGESPLSSIPLNADLNSHHSWAPHALKGHGFSRAVSCCPYDGFRFSVESQSQNQSQKLLGKGDKGLPQQLLTLILTLTFDRESKAIIRTAAYGTAEAVPLQGVRCP